MRAFVRAAVAGPGTEDRSAAAFLVTSVLESQRHPDLSPDEQRHPERHSRVRVVGAARGRRAAGESAPAVDVDAAAEMLLAMLLGLGFYAGFVGDQERVVTITEQFVRLLRGQAFVRSRHSCPRRFRHADEPV